MRPSSPSRGTTGRGAGEGVTSSPDCTAPSPLGAQVRGAVVVLGGGSFDLFHCLPPVPGTRHIQNSLEPRLCLLFSAVHCRTQKKSLAGLPGDVGIFLPGTGAGQLRGSSRAPHPHTGTPRKPAFTAPRLPHVPPCVPRGTYCTPGAVLATGDAVTQTASALQKPAFGRVPGEAGLRPGVCSESGPREDRGCAGQPGARRCDQVNPEESIRKVFTEGMALDGLSFQGHRCSGAG